MEKQSSPGRLLVTIPEAAVALGIGRTLAYELVLKGELPSVKLGWARRIPVAMLQAWVERLVAELPGEHMPDATGKPGRDSKRLGVSG